MAKHRNTSHQNGVHYLLHDTLYMLNVDTNNRRAFLQDTTTRTHSRVSMITHRAECKNTQRVWCSINKHKHTTPTKLVGIRYHANFFMLRAATDRDAIAGRETVRCGNSQNGKRKIDSDARCVCCSAHGYRRNARARDTARCWART